MYNRYVPQPDGSYQRNRMPDNARPPGKPQKMQPSSAPTPPQAQRESHESIGGFLQQLLPKDFDTGDLLIVLLLLLMAGDREEERNHALLTLALYLFM